MSLYPQFAFYGHHKCATMTINSVVGAVCRRLGMSFEAVYDEDQFDGDLQAFTASRRIDFLAYGNADIQYVRQLPQHRGFHIVRDPRDIVVSAYFSHLYSHSTKAWPELLAHREALQSASFEEGLAMEIEFRARSFGHMQRWDYSQDNILEVRFEDFVTSTNDSLVKIFDFLGLASGDDYNFSRRMVGLYQEFAAILRAKAGMTIPRVMMPEQLAVPDLMTINWRNRFQAKSRGRKQGTENVHSHYRKGRSGEWSEQFTADHKKLFKRLYPGLIPDLGYESSDNW